MAAAWPSHDRASATRRGPGTAHRLRREEIKVLLIFVIFSGRKRKVFDAERVRQLLARLPRSRNREEVYILLAADIHKVA